MRFKEGAPPLSTLDPGEQDIAARELIDGQPEQEDDKVHYPDIPDIGVGLGERAPDIFGSRVRSADRDTRLTAIVDTITEIIPGSLPAGTIAAHAPRARRDTDRFLLTKVQVPGGVEMKRQDIVNRAYIRDRLGWTLLGENHPIFQALQSLGELNQARIEGNEAKEQGDLVLTQAQLDETTDDVLRATQGPEIIKITDSIIKFAPALAKDAIEKAKQEGQPQS